MPWHGDFFRRTLSFNFVARTSRGRMTQKDSWFLRVWQPDRPECRGVGECSLLPGLSPEKADEIESVLAQVLARLPTLPEDVASLPLNDLGECVVRHFEAARLPAVRFAIETALLDWAGGGRQALFANSFVQGEPIPINGLIWMGGLDFMLQQIELKIREGFTTLKLKVGGLDFERECDILQYIRSKYFRDRITIRLDANGAFKGEDALYKLNQLAKFDVHSIEQPLPVGSPLWPAVCRESPIPVALDEELIGVEDAEARRQLLDTLKPRYIILKPSLHGGLSGSAAWIELARSMGVGYWMTSALESNVGLNAIAQFTATRPVEVPQGLGTGALYQNNWASPLEVRAGHLHYNVDGAWEPLIPEVLSDEPEG
jgi:o-succinylbenzoate synthase